MNYLGRKKANVDGWVAWPGWLPGAAYIVGASGLGVAHLVPSHNLTCSGHRVKVVQNEERKLCQDAAVPRALTLALELDPGVRTPGLQCSGSYRHWS